MTYPCCGRAVLGARAGRTADVDAGRRIGWRIDALRAQRAAFNDLIAHATGDALAGTPVDLLAVEVEARALDVLRMETVMSWPKVSGN